MPLVCRCCALRPTRTLYDVWVFRCNVACSPEHTPTTLPSLAPRTACQLLPDLELLRSDCYASKAYHTGTSSWSGSDVWTVGYLGQRGKAASLPLVRRRSADDFSALTASPQSSRGIMIKGRSLRSECLPTGYRLPYNNVQVCARSSPVSFKIPK